LSHAVTQCVDISHHGRCLRVAGEIRTEFGLNTRKGGGKLISRAGSSFDLGEGLVKDLGDVEETDDIAIVIANGLSSAQSELVHSQDA